MICSEKKRKETIKGSSYWIDLYFTVYCSVTYHFEFNSSATLFLFLLKTQLPLPKCSCFLLYSPNSLGKNNNLSFRLQAIRGRPVVCAPIIRMRSVERHPYHVIKFVYVTSWYLARGNDRESSLPSISFSIVSTLSFP